MTNCALAHDFQREIFMEENIERKQTKENSQTESAENKKKVNENPYAEIEKIKAKKKTNAKKAMFNAFLELYQTNDISDISVTKLCEKALCARTTFYCNFNNVEDVLRELEDDIIAEFFSLCKALFAGNRRRDYNEKNVRMLMVFGDNYTDTLRVLLVVRPDQRLKTSIENITKYFVWELLAAKGHAFDSDSTRFLSDVIASVVLTIVIHYVSGSENVNYNYAFDIVREAIDALLALDPPDDTIQEYAW